jgi:hypothetical protein
MQTWSTPTFDDPIPRLITWADESNWNERSGFDNAYTYPTRIPDGWGMVNDQWIWTKGAESEPVNKPWDSSNATRIGKTVTGADLDAAWNALPENIKAIYRSNGVSYGQYFMQNGTTLPGDIASVPNVLAWQEMNRQAQRNTSGSDFGDYLVMGLGMAVAGMGALGYGAATAGEVLAASAAETASLTASAATSTGVSSSTAAAFAAPTSTTGLYNAAISSAINTGVADYAAAAVAGETVGAGAAFTMLPVSSLGPAVTAGFLETAMEVARGVKTAVNTIQLVNKATGARSIVPKNSPVPPGYTVDVNWSPNLGDTVGKLNYDPASGALVLQSPDAAVVAPAAGTLSPGLVLAAAAAAVFFLVK